MAVILPCPRLRSPLISQGFALWGEIFAYVTGILFVCLFVFVFCMVVFNPTIEVVTFRLRGWCMQAVFFYSWHSIV